MKSQATERIKIFVANASLTLAGNSRETQVEIALNSEDTIGKFWIRTIQGVPSRGNYFLSNAAVFSSGEVTAEACTASRAVLRHLLSAAATLGSTVSSRRVAGRTLLWIRAGGRFHLSFQVRGPFQAWCYSGCAWTWWTQRWNRILSLNCITIHNLSDFKKNQVIHRLLLPTLAIKQHLHSLMKVHLFVLKSSILPFSEIVCAVWQGTRGLFSDFPALFCSKRDFCDGISNSRKEKEKEKELLGSEGAAHSDMSCFFLPSPLPIPFHHSEETEHENRNNRRSLYSVKGMPPPRAELLPGT